MIKKFNNFINEELSDNAKLNYLSTLVKLGHDKRAINHIKKNSLGGPFKFRMYRNYKEKGEKSWGSGDIANLYPMGIKLYLSCSGGSEFDADSLRKIFGTNTISTNKKQLHYYNLREILKEKTVLTIAINFMVDDLEDYRGHNTYSSSFEEIKLSIAFDKEINFKNQIGSKYIFREYENNIDDNQDISIDTDFIVLNVDNKLLSKEEAIIFKKFLSNLLKNSSTCRSFFIDNSISAESLKTLSENILRLPTSYMYDEKNQEQSWKTKKFIK
jgi:hypothetical protein